MRYGRRVRRTLTACGLFSVTVLIAACGSSGPKAANAGNTAGGTGTSSADANKTYKIGIILPSLTGDPFYQAVEEGIKDAAAANPNLKLDYNYGSGQIPIASQQIQLIQGALTKQDKALIVVDAFPPAKPVLQKALAQKVPVIIVNADLTGLSPKDAVNVGIDQAHDGVIAAHYIQKLLAGKQNPQVALLEIPPTIPASYARTNVAAKLLKNAGIPVVARESVGLCVLDQGEKDAQDVLTAHPGLSLIYAACGSPTVGAATAIKRAGMTGKVLLLGHDASSAELPLIKSGREIASIGTQAIEEGYYGVCAATKWLTTGQMPGGVVLPSALVTKATLNTWQVTPTHC